MSEVDDLILQLKKREREYLEDYLMNAPRWLMEAFQLVSIPKNTVFIRENEQVDMVYLLVEGMVKGTDYSIYEITYDYMLFRAVEVFGVMEFLMDVDRYQTTLITITKCRFLKISKAHFEKWMIGDIHALRMQTKAMSTYLLEEVKKDRLYLFLQGEDRISFLLQSFFEKEAVDGICVIPMNRNDLARSTGISVRTVNRTVAELEKRGLLTKNKRKIIINKVQYNQLREIMADRISRLSD